jgi:hypothetical protein
METWKDIIGLDLASTSYEVSNMGNARRSKKITVLKDGRITNPTTMLRKCNPDKYGYLGTNLSNLQKPYNNKDGS